MKCDRLRTCRSCAGTPGRWLRCWHAPSVGSGCWSKREYATAAELAEREGIAPSYMARVLFPTLLAPEIVEAVLERRHGPEVTLAPLLEPFPSEWRAQRLTLTKSPLTAQSGPTSIVLRSSTGLISHGPDMCHGRQECSDRALLITSGSQGRPPCPPRRNST